MRNGAIITDENLYQLCMIRPSTKLKCRGHSRLIINPPTRVDRIRVNLNFNPLPFAPGAIYAQIFFNMEPSDKYPPHS